MRSIKYLPHQVVLDIKPPYSISDSLFDKYLLAIKKTEISDITPHGNFVYGNKTGAIWLRINVLTRDGFTVKDAIDKLTLIFKEIKS